MTLYSPPLPRAALGGDAVLCYGVLRYTRCRVPLHYVYYAVSIGLHGPAPRCPALPRPIPPVHVAHGMWHCPTLCYRTL